MKRLDKENTDEMPYTFILKGEPKSLNGSKNHIEFEKELLDQFKQKYPKQPGEKAFYDYSRPLYVQIYYFCKNKRGRDVDNIMKYMIDSFDKYLYKSDRQIYYTLCQSIEIYDNQMTSVSVTDFDEETAATLYEFLNSEDRDWKSCTYFECGVMTDKFYHLDLENTWK